MATPTAVAISSANLNGHSRPQPTKLAITPISAASPPASSVASPISGVSTPTSAQLAIKPASAALQATTMATVAVAKGTITSKEWVVPPRPKPGRKPATDTPPTKRKAQNRAAQRAFRERRAARVGELEEQLEELEPPASESSPSMPFKEALAATHNTELSQYSIPASWMNMPLKEPSIKLAVSFPITVNNTSSNPIIT